MVKRNRERNSDDMTPTPTPSKNGFFSSPFGVAEEIDMCNEEAKRNDERIIVNTSSNSPARTSVTDCINNGGCVGTRNGSRNDSLQSDYIFAK